MRNILDQLAQAWAQHQSAIVLGAAAVIIVLLAIAAWRFARTRERSKVVSTLAAVIVMAWTSEGLFAVARERIHLPLAFASVTFCVFEAMLAAAWLKAEEHRRVKGTPGAAGAYAFVIASAQGIVAAFGSHFAGEVVLRLILPPLAVGLAWILLVAERVDDKPEWKEERRRRAAEREATWAITPRTILVKVGLMKPGRTTTTEAQREHQIARMVVAADTIAANGRGVARARTRLRRLARTADAEMIATVAERVRQAVEAERLMVPDVDGQRDGGRAQEVPALMQADSRADLPAALPAVVPVAPAPALTAALPGPRRSAVRSVVAERTEQDTRAAGQRTDDDLLAEHGPALAVVLQSTGKLSRYRVEQTCGVGGRQADRIKTAIEDGWRPPINGVAVR